MSIRKLAYVYLAACGVACSTSAQSPRGGITTLVLGLDVANGIVAPAPGSRVRVPPGEEVHLKAPVGWDYPSQWTKNGAAIAGATGSTLTLSLVTSSDSGTYSLAGAPFPLVATPIKLDVVPEGHVANFSSLLQLAPAGGANTIGFVVTGQTSGSFLFRAVGPSLAAFGINRTAALPRFRCYDSTGKLVSFNRIDLAWDWPATFASVGAFPLGGGELPGTSFNVYPLEPGAYTIQVTDDSGKGGIVLFEAYGGASLVPLGQAVTGAH
jgi:hypothetical protein